jgi:hypothetical protein
MKPRTPQPKPRSAETGTPVQVRLQRKLLDMVDDWRRTQDDIPTRGEAIRRLLNCAFERGTQ